MNPRNTKAVDIIYIDGKTLWLIEVKDYRSELSKNPFDLVQEVAQKARDTLSGLTAAQCKASNPDEKQFAKEALQVNHIRVVLHLERPPQSTSGQPSKPSKHDFRVMGIADLTQYMRKHLQDIYARVEVVDRSTLKKPISWRVTSV